MKSLTRGGYSVLSVVLLLFLGLTFANCEGPTGVDGTDGQDGAPGPAGPAGEDGSMIYTGEGAPTNEIGSTGDYYLNVETGELYGPKENSEWGDPIIVLMGEDGEDGSQIYAGEGEPEESLGTEGDYYLDKENYDLYGPKTSDEWGSPLSLNGAGSAPGVVRFIFPGHDFNEDTGSHEYTMEIHLGEESVDDYIWLAYMTNENSWKYQVPGPAYDAMGQPVSYYNFYFSSPNDPDEPSMFVIGLVDGPGEEYDPVELIQIKISEHTAMKASEMQKDLSEVLDLSDYDEVAEYFGFYNK